eukprot:10852292-Prorocentrum_lima.AAC.1
MTLVSDSVAPRSAGSGALSQARHQTASGSKHLARPCAHGVRDLDIVEVGVPVSETVDGVLDFIRSS